MFTRSQDTDAPEHTATWPEGRYNYTKDPGPPEGWEPPPLDCNPLEDLYRYVGGEDCANEYGLLPFDGDARWYQRSNARRHATSSYSWAVPAEGALAICADYGPLIEVGAGRGYWSALLELRGVDVIATDAHLYLPSFCGIVRMSAEDAAAAHPERTLLMIWPPYDNEMAARALSAYQGETLIYVGEGAGGCTANDDFFEALYEEWHEVNSCYIPQWHAIHDHLSVYQRGAEE